MNAPLLELQDVNRTYGGAVPVHALAEVSLCIRAGEFVALVGPSGSGKSTLLGLLGLLDRPTSGTIRIEDRDISRARDGRRTRERGRSIGFVFQQFHLIPHLTALGNVETALLYRRLGRRQRRRRAMEVLTQVGLAERATHRPVELSGGEQQRVAIARALVTDPRIILADEPTGALDSANAELVMEVLQSLPDESRAVVMVTHDLALADRADRQIRLRDGHIVKDTGPPLELGSPS